jgi:ligand-binding sensor protein
MLEWEDMGTGRGNVLVTNEVSKREKEQEMKLVELMPIERWIEVEKEINRLSGLNAGVYDIEGRRITEFKKWANPLCPAIRETEKGLKFICSVAHQNVAARLVKSRKTIVDECDAGMMKLAVPIFVDDEFLGVAGGCGKLWNGGRVDTYLVHRTAGLAEGAITSLSESVKQVAIDRLTLVVEYLEEKVDELAREFGTVYKVQFEQAT